VVAGADVFLSTTGARWEFASGGGYACGVRALCGSSNPILGEMGLARLQGSLPMPDWCL
jgi:hypothetical protein